MKSVNVNHFDHFVVSVVLFRKMLIGIRPAFLLFYVGAIDKNEIEIQIKAIKKSVFYYTK